MSTVQTIVDGVRVRIGETTARKWSDTTQLIPYVSRAERWLAGHLSRIPKSRRFRTLHESVTLAANGTSINLASLAKTFDWLISVSVLHTNTEVRLINFEDGDAPYLRNAGLGGGSPISLIDTQDDNLVVLPAYGSARTFYIDYGWVPLAKTSSAALIETPDKYDDLLELRAMHFALADVGIRNTAFEEEYAGRLLEVEDMERSRRGISNERVIQRARTFARCN